MAEKMRLGDLLVESKIITAQQLSSALEVQKTSNGKKLGFILVDLGIITEEQMLAVLQKKLNIPMVNLAKLQVTDALLDSLPEDVAREKSVFPYRLQGRSLYIATADPLDYEVLNTIGVSTGRNVEAVLTTRDDIQAAINKYYRKHNMDVMASALNQSTSLAQEAEQLATVDFNELESRVGSVPVVRFINNLISQAHNKRASDVHVEPMEDSVRIRFRIDSSLVEIVKINTATLSSIITRMKIMSGMDIAEKRVPQDGRFSFDLENGGTLNVRAASMPTVYGEKIVLRLMPDNKTSGIVPLEELGANETNAALIRKVMANPNGLILVTGPTGSGKSTTLYSVLNELSEVNTNILTVEDPVEKIVPGVNQTQVNVKAGLTFATGLRAILRQDPDKIMIGEVRDNETADIAARAAITGHLVLASLHTNSAAAAYMRLIDMGVEPYIIASSIIAVVAQRLVKLVCPHCKYEYDLSEADLRFFERLNTEPPKKLHNGKGCEKCDFTGSYGRVAVMEVILTDHKIRDMIMSKATDEEIEAYLKEHKNQRFMIDNAVDLVNSGKVSIQELLTLVQSLDL